MYEYRNSASGDYRSGFEVAVSNNTDFTSILNVGGKIFSITHYETRPGVAYLTELAQDKSTGKLTVSESRKDVQTCAWCIPAMPLD